MATTRIILWFGYALLALALAMLLSAFVGVLIEENLAASGLALGGIITGLSGTIIAIALRGAGSQERPKDALYFMILFWVGLPIFAGLPYRILDLTDSFITGYFEAASALTTTGASTFIPEYLPYSVRLFRSLLEWCGGGAIAVIAVVILAALNLSGTGVHKSMLFTLKKGDLFRRFISIGKPVAAVYAILSFILFVCLAIAGTGFMDALILSLSAPATGGMAPRTDPLLVYVNPFGLTILSFVCLLGASNIAILWDVFRLRHGRSVKSLLSNSEWIGMVYAILLLTFFGVIFAGFSRVFPVLSEAVLLVSTSGMNVSDAGLEAVPSALLIALALIGGSALSTAGGLKMIRMILLVRHVSADFETLSHPSRVQRITFRGRVLDDKAFVSIWMYFFGFTVAFGLSIVMLGFFGLDFVPSVSAAAAALSNTGPLLQMTTDITYANMDPGVLAVLSATMILGRIEVLAVLAAIAPSVWRL